MPRRKKEEKKEGYEAPKSIEFKVILEENQEKYKNIRELEGETFYVEDFDIEDRPNGTIAYIKTDRGTYYTWSRVLIKQLELMNDYIDRGYRVKVTLVRRKNYLTFT